MYKIEFVSHYDKRLQMGSDLQYFWYVDGDRGSWRIQMLGSELTE